MAKLTRFLLAALLGLHSLNGTAALIFQDASGSIQFWVMDGKQVSVISTANWLGSEWHLVGVQDLNGDGYEDVVLQSSRTGEILVWTMKGGAVVGANSLGVPFPATLKASSLARFDGDPRVSQIVMLDESSGSTSLWNLAFDPVKNRVYVASTQYILDSFGKPISLTNGYKLVGQGNIEGPTHAPQLYRAVPAVGPASGKTRIKLEGKNIQVGSLVTIGGIKCDQVLVDPNGNSISCVLGNYSLSTGSPLPLDVVVTAPNHQIALLPSAFTYLKDSRMIQRSFINPVQVGNNPAVTSPGGLLAVSFALTFPEGMDFVSTKGGSESSGSGSFLPDFDIVVKSLGGTEIHREPLSNVIRNPGTKASFFQFSTMASTDFSTSNGVRMVTIQYTVVMVMVSSAFGYGGLYQFDFENFKTPDGLVIQPTHSGMWSSGLIFQVI